MQVKKGSSVGTAIAKTGAFKDDPGCEREKTVKKKTCVTMHSNARAKEAKETKPSNPHAVRVADATPPFPMQLAAN